MEQEVKDLRVPRSGAAKAQMPGAEGMFRPLRGGGAEVRVGQGGGSRGLGTPPVYLCIMRGPKQTSNL